MRIGHNRFPEQRIGDAGREPGQAQSDFERNQQPTEPKAPSYAGREAVADWLRNAYQLPGQAPIAFMTALRLVREAESGGGGAVVDKYDVRLQSKIRHWERTKRLCPK
jgi:hypothetical protein